MAPATPATSTAPPADPRRVANMFRHVGEMFADVFQTYLEADEQVQEVVRAMVQIVNDPHADDDERAAALDTLIEALFPTFQDGAPGFDLEQMRAGALADMEDETHLAELDQAAFADRVKALMEERRITQSELARRVGVGQPAISMLLGRSSRPQQATVRKVADALGVEAIDLWPVREEPT